MPLTPAGPAAERLGRLHPDESVGPALEAHGFTSALEIAHLSGEHFVAQIAPALGSEEQARDVYARATQVRSAVMHAWANAQTAIASPQFGALRVGNVGDDALKAFDDLPSYQELVGGANYCDCEECRSVLGPAAYLVDLLRVIDTHVHAPNGEAIPAGYRLDQRRPDVFSLPLTCANANDVFPTLRIVVERLTAQAGTLLGLPPESVPEALQDLDVNWERIGLALGLVGARTADLYRVFDAPHADLARAQLGMSVREFSYLTTPQPQDVVRAFGVDGAASLAQVPVLLTATGLDGAALEELLTQDLDEAELQAGVADGFFVNGAGRLTIVPGDPATIAGLPADPSEALDRINRFVRLARRLGWSATELDWVLRATNAGTAEISPETLTTLWDVSDIASLAGLDAVDAAALVGVMKPYGGGETPSQFDAVFNDPAVLAGRAPYHPPTQLSLNPLYTDPVQTWVVGDESPEAERTAAWLAASLGVPPLTLQKLAVALFGDDATVELSFLTLCALHRHAVLLRTTRLAPDDYVAFMTLTGGMQLGLLPRVVREALDDAAWLARSGLTLAQVDYFLGADPGPTVDPLFVAGEVPTWLGAVGHAVAAHEGDELTSALLAQVAGLFGAPQDVVDAVHPLVVEGDFVAAFTAPDTGAVLAYLSTMSRWLVLIGALGLPPALVESVAAHPDAYGFAAPRTLESIRSLSTFRDFMTGYGDTAGRLIAFAEAPAVASLEAAQPLVEATGWQLSQLEPLMVALAEETNHVRALETLATQIAALEPLGGDAALARRVVDATSDGATSWTDAAALADLVVARVRAGVADAQWPALSQQLEGAMAEKLRAALVPLVCSLTKLDAREVSEYLLVDVETSGVVQTSRVREAIAAAQTYLQRCRLRLEPLATLDIPEVWWEWLMGYRVWEANREIFLYPENYFDPSLRRSKTPLFAELEDELRQGQLTEDAVESTYRSYVDELVDLASLHIADAYGTTIDGIDTTFLVARTARTPYRYHVSVCSAGAWSAWRPVDVAIASPHATPVYAFNKLFLFWVELRESKSTDIPAGKTGTQRGVSWSATIKYTHTDLNDRWIQAQELVSDQLVYYTIEGDATTGDDDLDAFNVWKMSRVDWNKPFLVLVDPAAGDPAQQRLVVLYGPLLESAEHFTPFRRPFVAPPPPKDGEPKTAAWERYRTGVVLRWNELLAGTADDMSGYLPMTDGIVLDHQLDESFLSRPNEVVVLAKDPEQESPPLVLPVLEAATGKVFVTPGDSAHAVESLADAGVRNAGVRPASIGPDTFASETIDAATSHAVYESLQRHHKLSGSAVNRDLLVEPGLQFLVDEKILDETEVPRIRDILMRGLGDPVLFDNLPKAASRVVAVKNRPGSFLVATGEETFLLTPRELSYAVGSTATEATGVASSPVVFSTDFDEVGADSAQIFADLRNLGIVSGSGDSGELASSFSASTPLELFTDRLDSPDRDDLIAHVRRILLSLPRITRLDYRGRPLPRWVTRDGFTGPGIDPPTSQKIFDQLVAGGVLDATGRVLTVVGETGDLSWVLEDVDDPQRHEMLVRVLKVLRELPRFVTVDAIAAAAGVDEATAIQVRDSLVQHAVIDAAGAVTKPLYVADNGLPFLLTGNGGPLLGGQAGAVAGLLMGLDDATYRVDVNAVRFRTERLSARSSARELSHVLFTAGLDAALSLETQNAPPVPKLPFFRLDPARWTIEPPALADGAQIAFDGPYGLYYWELFFHAPLLVAKALAADQRFEDAKRWMERVLDPTATETPLTPASFAGGAITDAEAADIFTALVDAGVLVTDSAGATRVAAGWSQTAFDNAMGVRDPAAAGRAFAVVENAQLATAASRFWQFRPFRNHTMETLGEVLTDSAQVATYNADPFDPDAIARLRIGAYEKATLMAYVDMLLAWGDMLFTEYTSESVSNALLIYLFANDLLGDRPVSVGRSAEDEARSFDDLKKWYEPGEVPQFLIDLEHWLPGPPSGAPPQPVVGDALNVLDAYFCVPPNQALDGYWDRVEDRLRKIRHGENIEGVPSPLPLYDPPIDPALLARAAASGAGFLGAADAALQKPTSYYRFATLHREAVEMASLVTDLGAALLAALDRKDAAALDALRATHEAAILDMTTSIRQDRIDELNRTLDALTVRRDRAKAAATHYDDLASGSPTTDEIVAASAMLASGLAWSASTPARLSAGFMYLEPNIFGMAEGGTSLGGFVNQEAESMTSAARALHTGAELAFKIAERDRRVSDWQFRHDRADREQQAYDKQIAAVQARLAAAEQELKVHERTIKQSAATASTMTARFTSGELYQWMADRLSAVYFQAYTTAVSLARQAELAYRYELGSDDTFIQLAYWDGLRKGLTAGETLTFSLARMKAAYLEANQRDLEIVKEVSLLELDPQHVLDLRAGRPASFSLTETLFDFDFPGHYMRRIASVSVTIAGVGGAVNATLVQDRNRVVMRPDRSLVEYLVALDQGRDAGGEPVGIRTDWLPQQAIALSRATGDAGVFSLEFGGEQYLPFEGTGAVSDWTLSIPPGSNRVDLTRLTDVVIELRYTARDGGLRDEVLDVLRQAGSRLAGRVHVATREAFPAAWPALEQTGSLTLEIGPDVLPHLPSMRLEQVAVQVDVADGVSLPSGEPAATLAIGSHTEDLTFVDGLAIAAAPLSDFHGTWSLKLDPALLDPAAVTDVELLLTYSTGVAP